MRSQGRKIDWRLRGVFVVTAIAAFVAGVEWRGGQRVTERGAGASMAQAARPEGKTTWYYCAMHPQIRAPEKGKCPICFMDLIPLPAEEAGEETPGNTPRLRLSPAAAARLDIRVVPVERGAIEVTVPLFGKVEYDERRVYDVATRTEAYVERLLVNTPWQPVRRGELLAEFYSPAVAAAFRELLVAKADSAEALNAARTRLERQGVGPAQIEEVLRTGIVPRTFRVESPAAGAVMPPSARAGEWLSEGARSMRIVDLSRVWVQLEAFERDLPWLREGQRVTFQPAAWPGETFEGSISFIEPVVNDRTRTARLRVEVENPHGRLKPGMYVSAQARVAYPDREARGPSEAPLIIPASAPLLTGRRALVYLRLPDTEWPVFEAREITLGPRAGDLYVVREGLREGDLVVVSGQFKIDSELQIRGRPSMMSPASSGAAAPSHHAHGGE